MPENILCSNPNCRHSNPADALYCEMCGTALTVSATKDKPSEPMKANPQDNPPTQSNSDSGAANRREIFVVDNTHNTGAVAIGPGASATQKNYHLGEAPRKCQKCGTIVAKQDLFCSGCGIKLAA